MASLLIRNLEDSIKQSIRLRAAQHGRSMEAEARAILKESIAPVAAPKPQEHLWFRVRRLVEQYGSVELDLPPREMGPEPPDFS